MCKSSSSREDEDKLKEDRNLNLNGYLGEDNDGNQLLLDDYDYDSNYDPDSEEVSPENTKIEQIGRPGRVGQGKNMSDDERLTQLYFEIMIKLNDEWNNSDNDSYFDNWEPVVGLYLRQSLRVISDIVQISSSQTTISLASSSSIQQPFHTASPLSPSLLDDANAIRVKIDTVSSLAYDQINAVPFYLVDQRWLRIYTDSTILRIVLDLHVEKVDVKLSLVGVGQEGARVEKDSREDGGHEGKRPGGGGMNKFWKEKIRRLDKAIIIAGSIGPNRRQWVLELIKHIQRMSSPSRNSRLHFSQSNSGRSSEVTIHGVKRKRSSPSLITSSLQQFELICSPNAVPTVHPSSSFPSVDTYLTTYVNSPLILKSYTGTPPSHPFTTNSISPRSNGNDSIDGGSDSDVVNQSPCPWPALELWRSGQALLDRVGEGRIVPVEIGESYDQVEWTQKLVSFRNFLHAAGFDVEPETDEDEDEDENDEESKGNFRNHQEQIFQSSSSSSPRPSSPSSKPPMYLAQYQLFNQFPQLLPDFTLPEYVWSDPPTPADMPNYHPPHTVDGGPDINVWIGPGKSSVTSPPHTDPYYNCYVQVLGRKRVWLAPPLSTPFMYAYGSTLTSSTFKSTSSSTSTLEHTSSSQPFESASQSIVSTSSAMTEYMTNTSTVPVFSIGQVKRTEEKQEELQSKFPLFFEHVYPVSLEAVLDPGDLLILPPGWWHSMRGESEGPSWSVSMWY